MTPISRRDVLAGLAASSAASILPAEGEPRQTADNERRRNADALLRYFASIAPLLLRAPDGILKYPCVAPSLPGKTYSTSLWDWDTLWTSQGLFRLAALQHDDGLRQKLCEHVSGSLLNFLEHASPGGQIPIMLTAKDPDPFRVLGKNPMSRNQAKPVFGQLGLLVCDQLGDVGWLEPHFDTILRFYESWVAHNSSQIGLLVWGDDVAIGDDNDPTTFGRPFFSSANLLLNCLFYQDLSASAEIAWRLKRTADGDRLAGQAQELGKRIQNFCWDPRDSYYYTVDVQCLDRRAELIPSVPRGMAMSWRCLPMRVQMFTGFLPALVRHRDGRECPEAGERQLSGGRPLACSVGREVAFVPGDYVLDGIQLEPEQLAGTRLDYRELLRMERAATIWIQEGGQRIGGQDASASGEGSCSEWLA
jgi:putative isomerase